MPFVVADRVRETTTSTGTGTITLSGTAPTGFQTFGTGIGNANNTFYTIAGGSEWEVGIGTYTAVGTTLSRDTVLASSAGGTTKVTFSAGTKDVFVTYPAGRSVYQEGSITAALGSVTAPSYSFVGDTNTGMFSPAADTLAFAEGGVEAMRIDSSGNVGIGTVSPSEKLDVNGNIKSGTGTNQAVLQPKQLVFYNTSVSEGVIRSADDTSVFTSIGVSKATLRFATLDNERMRINSAGDVGINTAAPGALLGVAGATLIGNQASTGTAGSLRFISTGGISYIQSGQNTTSASAAPLVFTDMNASGEWMRITSTGNVGIGTTAPNYKLEVRTDGASAFNWVSSFNNTAAGGFGAGFLARAAANIGYFYLRGDGLAYLENSSNNPIGFATNGLERARIDNNGNLLVGTTTTQGRFNVASATGTVGFNTGTSASPERGNLWYDTDGSGWKFYIGKRQGGTFTSQMAFQDNGDIGIGTTAPGAKLEVSNGSSASQIRIRGGTAGSSAPELQFYGNSSDHNWTIQGNHSSSLLFFKGTFGSLGTELMRLDINGQLGIGVTPTGKLDVNGNIRTSVGSGGTLTLHETDATRANQLISGADAFGSYINASFSTGGSAVLRIQTANTERMRVNSTGDVGIGTASPGGKLEVFQTAASPTIRMFTNFSGGNAVDLSPFITGVSNAGYSVTIGGTIRQVIDSSGNMGIGTTGPSTRIHASGSTANTPTIIRAQQTTTGNNFDYAAFSASTTGASGGFVAWATGSLRAGQVWVQSDGAQPLILGTNDTERVRIDTSGNMGVGTASPWERISLPFNTGLALGSSTYSFKIQRSSAGDLVTTFSDTYDASTARVDFTMRSGAGAQNTPLSILGSGNVGFGTTTPASRLAVAGTTAITWAASGTSSGLVTIGDQGTSGSSLFLNTPSLNSSFASGFGVDGSYTNPGGVGTSIINLKAFGVNSGGGYGSDMAFHTAVGSTLSEKFRITSTGAITSSALADAVGYKGIPQNSQTASYTLALSDMGKHISITTGGVVIPANGSVAFPIGSAVTIFNNSGSNQTISITTDTLRQAGTANTGSRTLAQYGVATVLKVTSTVWVISGAGVS